MFLIKWLFLQIKFLKNSFKEKGEQFLFRFILHGSIFLFGLILLFFFLIYMFDFATKRQIPAFDFATLFLSLFLLTSLPLLIYSSIVCALSLLFQKQEIAFFFSCPINRTGVFFVKFLQTAQHSGWMSFCSISTFIIAIQTYFRISPLIYLSAVFGAILYLLIPICIGVILTLILSLFIPFHRAKDALTVIGLFMGSLIVLILRLLRPERLVTAEGKIHLLAFVENLRSPWLTLLPNEWLVNVWFSHFKKDYLGIFLNLSILINPP